MGIDGVSDEWLRERVAFLKSRGNWHLELPSADWRHELCAATLFRDAGCLLLLLDEVESGRENLEKAGDLQVAQGQAGGLPLIAMCDPERAERAVLDYEILVERRRRGYDEAVEGLAENGRSMDAAGAGSLRSLLAVVQARMMVDRYHWISGRGYDSDQRGKWLERSGAARRELVDQYANREVGESGLSVRSYVDVVLALEEGSMGASNELAENAVEAIELLGRWRAQQLEAARRDAFHWRLVSRPSELVDLDSVALMSVVRDGQQIELRDRLGQSSDRMVWTPLEIAAKLVAHWRGRHRGSGFTR